MFSLLFYTDPPEAPSSYGHVLLCKWPKELIWLLLFCPCQPRHRPVPGGNPGARVPGRPGLRGPGVSVPGPQSGPGPWGHGAPGAGRHLGASACPSPGCSPGPLGHGTPEPLFPGNGHVGGALDPGAPIGAGLPGRGWAGAECYIRGFIRVSGPLAEGWVGPGAWGPGLFPRARSQTQTQT